MADVTDSGDADAGGDGNGLAKCLGCQNAERLLMEMADELRARDKLLLSRISALDDELSHLKLLIGNRVGTIEEKNKKKKKKNSEKPQANSEQASVQIECGTVSTDTARTVALPTDVARTVATATERPPAHEEVSKAADPDHMVTFNNVHGLAHSTVASVCDDSTLQRSPAHSDALSDSQESAVSSARKVSLPPLQEEDPWEGISYERPRRRKRVDVLVGNLRASTTENKLRDYIQSRVESACQGRDVPIHRIKVFAAKEGRDTLSARVTVDARDSSLLRSREFWPGRLYCRQYRYNTQQVQHESNGDRSNSERADNLLTACSTTLKPFSISLSNSFTFTEPENDSHATNPDESSAPATVSNSASGDAGNNFSLTLSPESSWGDTEENSVHTPDPTQRGAQQEAASAKTRSSAPPQHATQQDEQQDAANGESRSPEPIQHDAIDGKGVQTRRQVKSASTKSVSQSK